MVTTTTTTTTTMMLMRKMFVLMMMLMMMVMSVGKAFPDKTSIKELLKDFQTIDVRASSGDSNILCKDDKLDIAFIIDTSRSIHAHEYDQQIEFVMKLVSIFNISPQNIRVAAISFGQEVVRDSAFGFSTHKTKEKVLAGIKGIVYRGRDMGDQTETGTAIAFARKNVFSNTRPGVKRICVVLTDGRSTDPLQTKQEASYARKDGIKMIAVGIGNNVSMEELKAIASNGQLVFKIDSYELLPQFERHVMTQTCESK
ncbi:matrilin-4, partial [Octopus sinensis]|uniref:Matrilin-4 n=1 Tax=Octopus sinensis TaxID=2607531 RepID=A0A6P7TW04_9MOLL